MRIKVLESTNSLIIFSEEDGINKYIARGCDFFHYRNEEFNLQQNFLLLVWSIATCSVKVAQLVQILVATWQAHSFNHSSSIPPTKIATQPIQVALHCSKLPIQFEGCLLPLLTNALMIDHILPCLPMASLMLWHFCQSEQIMVYSSGQ